MKASGLIVAALAAALAGCGTNDQADRQGTAGSTGHAAVAPSGSSGLSTAQLAPGQRAALKRGCRQTQGYDAARYNQCVAGDLDSRMALERGCAERYAGNPARIRLCQGP